MITPYEFSAAAPADRRDAGLGTLMVVGAALAALCLGGFGCSAPERAEPAGVQRTSTLVQPVAGTIPTLTVVQEAD
jgi:hypothetical protein